MPPSPDPALLARRLAKLPATAGVAADDIRPMRQKGVAHRHFRIAGRGLVLRVPILSQWGMGAAENLAYQEACFRRAEPSGATPVLAAVLSPDDDLPRGALLVQDIVGTVPRLPTQLPSLAEALARIHRLPVPDVAMRPPLADHGAAGPVAATVAVIERQAPALEAPGIPAATRAALEDELAWARGWAARLAPAEQPLTLVGTDTHPGNFLVRADGSAALVDLEKAAYGSPAIDLAHATLFTSTHWDLDVAATLGPEATASFYRDYLARIPAGLAAQLRPLLAPSRRLTWLRTMMWCARWRVAAADPGGEWSETRVDPILLDHIRRRVALFFAPETVARIRAEWLDGPLDL
jgi:aminoglycoside phosphotransferase (APT) family kinase protein